MGPPIPGVISRPLLGWLKCARHEASIAASRVVAEDPLIDDGRPAISGLPCRNRGQSNPPLPSTLFPALVADRNPLFTDPFPGRLGVPGNVPKLRRPLPRLGSEKRTPFIADERSVISRGF